ncbi:MAG: di-trans,poly-cis-decaprenylcistransferase [Chloroflexi bacterium]|nr:di-trans,poly-cis-decaprenylcistransferase [Chloroflexota bacterium]
MAPSLRLPRKKTAPQAPPPRPLERVPLHVAIIMDGNGRWARQRGKPRLAGHRAGTENIRQIIERFSDYGVSYLTLYAFSTENWDRPRYEVLGLMRLLSMFLKREVGNLHENGIKLLHLGDPAPLPDGLQKQVRQAIELTKNNDRMTLSIAFNYGGRAEILEAVRAIVADGVAAERIDDALFSRYLFTNSLPDPDLIIRTAGEMRISNFLLWQGAYSELFFVDDYWPDFGVTHVDEVLTAYGRRRRRFGSLLPDETDAAAANGHGRSNGASSRFQNGHNGA